MNTILKNKKILIALGIVAVILVVFLVNQKVKIVLILC